jgi:deoxyribodipyrimidine photo-lyase
MELKLPTDRPTRLQYLRAAFPECVGADSTMIGTREAAMTALAAVNPTKYAATRNHLRGAVTRLSPYFRHGMLTLHEAAQWAIMRDGKQSYKFVFELAWRDFWRRVWWDKGEAVKRPLEEPKVMLGHASLPDDILQARTGLRCMDAFVRDLTETGYVHNHARMWFASYVVHHRKVDWRASADWYYRELLDGDWASNHLSWQWIASTFSAKPYIFNKENVERYSDRAYCASCTAKCPFDASYEALEIRLFGSPGELR